MFYYICCFVCPLGFPWVSSGHNKNAKMVPGGILGAPGEHLGDLGDLSRVWLILEPIFRGNVPKMTESCSKMSLSEFVSGSSRSSGCLQIHWIGTKWCTAGSSNRRFFAPGARMTVVKQTPSNKRYIIKYISYVISNILYIRPLLGRGH